MVGTNRYRWLILLSVVLWVTIIRVHDYHAPFDRDVGIYAVIGHEMMHGRRLYTDLFDHKPPAIYLTFAAAEAIAGYGEREIFLANLTGALLTVFFLFLISRRMGRGPAPLWAVVMGGLAVCSLHLEAVDANSEIFINAFLVGAFACVAGARFSWPRLLGAAALTAIASLYKHVAVVPGMAFISLMLLENAIEDRRWVRAATRLAAAGGVVAAFWGGTGLYFVMQGRGGDFWDAMVRFNIGYAGFEKGHWFSNTLLHLIEVFRGGAVIPLLTISTLALAPALLWVPGTPPFRRLCRLTSAYLAGAFVAVVLPDRYFAHYFQLLYPPVAVSIGLLATSAAEGTLIAFRPFVYALCLALIVPFATDSLRSLEQTPAALPAQYGYAFVPAKQLSAELDHLLKPSETFFNWGQESWLYFYSRRRPPAGIFIADHIRRGALRQKLTERTLAALNKTRPEVVVVSRWVSGRKAFDNPVGQWILDNYQPLPGGNRGYVYLMARKNGRLLTQAPSVRSPGARPLENHLDAVSKKIDPGFAAVERG